MTESGFSEAYLSTAGQVFGGLFIATVFAMFQLTRVVQDSTSMHAASEGWRRLVAVTGRIFIMVGFVGIAAALLLSDLRVVMMALNGLAGGPRERDLDPRSLQLLAYANVAFVGVLLLVDVGARELRRQSRKREQRANNAVKTTSIPSTAPRRIRELRGDGAS